MTDPRTVTTDLPTLQRRIRVARGLEPGDLLLTGGQVVNVFTGRVEAANVVLAWRIWQLTKCHDTRLGSSTESIRQDTA